MSNTSQGRSSNIPGIPSTKNNSTTQPKDSQLCASRVMCILFDTHPRVRVGAVEVRELSCSTLSPLIPHLSYLPFSIAKANHHISQPPNGPNTACLTSSRAALHEKLPGLLIVRVATANGAIRACSLGFPIGAPSGI